MASDGHYGFGATTTQRRYDGRGDLAAELRALVWALRKLLRYQLTIFTDYPEVENLLNAWRRGNVEAVPPGYDPERRDSGRRAKLLRAAHAVHSYADNVTVQLIESYADVPLNAGANELSQVGWSWCAGFIDKATAAERGLEIASRHLKVPPVLLAR